MDVDGILSKLISGDISKTEAEELLQPKPKRNRGRPKKAKAPSKKNGRPRYLSKHERDLAIMSARVVLDSPYLKLNWTSMEKRNYLRDQFCVSDKTIDAVITKLNRRVKNGEVYVCHETHEVLFDDITSPDHDGSLRKFPIKNYITKVSEFIFTGIAVTHR